MTEFRVPEIRAGRVRPLGPQGVASGIDKHPIHGAVVAGPTGLEGDEQGDRRHHGGPDKAIHAYASSHYPEWIRDLPETAHHFRPGAFGENLVVEGLDEDGICLGDHWRLGDVLLEVSQGRQPCWRLNLRFERPDMARLLQATGRTGWYFRVIEPGTLHAGMTARLVARPHPGWSISRTAHLLYHDRLNMRDLAEFASLPGLPESWRRLAEARLERREVENWSRRIDTPS